MIPEMRSVNSYERGASGVVYGLLEHVFCA
jgi:hypothetical protein